MAAKCEYNNGGGGKKRVGKMGSYKNFTNFYN